MLVSRIIIEYNNFLKITVTIGIAYNEETFLHQTWYDWKTRIAHTHVPPVVLRDVMYHRNVQVIMGMIIMFQLNGGGSIKINHPRINSFSYFSFFKKAARNRKESYKQYRNTRIKKIINEYYIKNYANLKMHNFKSIV